MLHLNNGNVILFPPDIWKFNYQFDYELLKPKIDNLFSLVESNSKLETGSAISTVTLDSSVQPHTWAELADFQNWLGEKIADIRKELGFTNGYSEVVGSWFNKHSYNGSTIEHNHNYTIFTIAAYIKLPANSGFIEFKDPLEYHKTMYPIIPEETLYKELPATTNDVLIFPGYIRHRVQPNKSNDDRIVLTINIK